MWVFAGLALVVLVISLLSVFFGKANKGFQIFISSFFFLSIIWYIPGSYQLFDWIYITNFDYLAKATGNRLGRPAYEFALFYVKKWGWFPIVLFAFYLIENRLQIFTKRAKAIWFLFVAIVLFPSLGGILSYNGDVRYYYAGWLVFTAVLLAEFLKKEGRARLARPGGFAAAGKSKDPADPRVCGGGLRAARRHGDGDGGGRRLSGDGRGTARPAER